MPNTPNTIHFNDSYKKTYCGVGFFGIYLLIAFLIGFSISGTEYGLSLLLFAVMTIGISAISWIYGSFWFLFNFENLEIVYNQLLSYCGIESAIGIQALFYPLVIFSSMMNLILIIALGTLIGIKINESIAEMIESVRNRFKR